MKRLALALAITMVLAAAPAHAADPYNLTLGAALGAGAGFVIGGTCLAFLTQHPDRDYPGFLWVGAASGMLLGTLYGALMPGEEVKPTPPVYGPEASLVNVEAGSTGVRVEPRAAIPAIAVDAATDAWSAHAGLLRVAF